MVDIRSVVGSPTVPARPGPGLATLVLVVGVSALLASLAYVGHGMGVVTRHASVGTAIPSYGARPPVPVPAAVPVVVPVVPRTITFRVEGTAPRARVDYSLDAGVDGGTEVALPWTGTLTTRQDGVHSSSVFAYPAPGAPGGLTCTILDQDGRVLARHTVDDPAASTGVDCVS